MAVLSARNHRQATPVTACLLMLLAELRSILAAREEALRTAEDRMAALRAEMLLREESYNKHFRNGGMGERVLNVGSAAGAHSEVMGWMLKGAGGTAAAHSSGNTANGLGVGSAGINTARRGTGDSGGSDGGTHRRGSGDQQLQGGAGGRHLAAPGVLRAPTGSFKRM